MKLVVGLGNPGNDYRNTFHNIGFRAVDKFAALSSATAFAYDKKGNADIAELASAEKTLLVKPQTFMNLSGDAVAHYVHYYKLEPRDMLVIYDDIDIPKGTVRARISGSAGTHNGMRDIVGKLGSTEFARVRIGIGFKPNYMGLADYVLSHIGTAETPALDAACLAACDYVKQWLCGKPWQELTVTVGG